eukprot:5614602-Amphidinium_carterae.7
MHQGEREGRETSQHQTMTFYHKFQSYQMTTSRSTRMKGKVSLTTRKLSTTTGYSRLLQHTLNTLKRLKANLTGLYYSAAEIARVDSRHGDNYIPHTMKERNNHNSYILSTG